MIMDAATKVVQAARARLDRFLAPHPRLTELSDRMGARLFTALLLVHILVSTVALVIDNAMWIWLEGRSIWRDQDTWVVIGAIAAHGVSLVLIKAGRYRIGVLSYLVVTASAGLISPFVPDPNAEIGLVAAALLPLILAAIAFTPKQVALVLAIVVGVGAIQISFSDLASRQRITTAVILFLVALGGGLLIVFRTHLDKLERLRTAQLREGERRYRDLFENANDAILVAQEGRVVFFNPRLEAMLGLPRADIEDRSFEVFLHPEDRPLVRARLVRGGDPPESNEVRLVFAGGSFRWASLRSVLMEWRGRPATLSFLTDITERKRSEEERSRLEAQLLQAQKMESVGRLAAVWPTISTTCSARSSGTRIWPWRSRTPRTRSLESCVRLGRRRSDRRI